MGGADTRETVLEQNRNRVFSRSEANEFEKFLDNRYGTGTPINWVDVKTKQPVNWSDSK